jgi:hypothetical protein
MSYSDSGKPEGSGGLVRVELGRSSAKRAQRVSCPQLFLKIKPFLKDISSSQSGQQLLDFPERQAMSETGEEPVNEREQGPFLPGLA